MPIFTKPDTYTTLLIHSDNAHDNQDFVDSGKGGYSVTASGNARHVDSRDNAPIFGNTTMYFDSNGDYLTIPASAEHNFTTSDSYTVDFWMYPTATSGNPCIYAGWGTADEGNSAGDHYLYYSVSNGRLYWGAVNVNSTGAEWYPGLIVTNQKWQHIALVYDADGGKAYAFQNGIRANSVSGPAVCSITATNDAFTIGDLSLIHI